MPQNGTKPVRKPAVAAKPAPATTKPFWKKGLDALSRAEWEALCDGCGRCCLVKLEDEDTGKIHFTDIVCRLFEAKSCRCSDYPGRKAKVPDCIKLTPKRVREIKWLPPTCAYRLVDEGKDLYPWHHLISGSRETVHKAGVSLRGRAGPSEDDVPDDELLDHIVRWPGKVPPPRKF
ncbi:MAG: YcgN family cysteine cluster protein [Rhizobiales bacterium]|mgnify:FL=1|nr:YcgN family cysteine cluster protein [Hyphomicrobiales bacterium]